MSGLVDGKIPPRTPCPFRNRCGIAHDGGCYHKGEAHEVAFSCAIARGFALIERNKRAEAEEWDAILSEPPKSVTKPER